MQNALNLSFDKKVSIQKSESINRKFIIRKYGGGWRFQKKIKTFKRIFQATDNPVIFKNHKVCLEFYYPDIEKGIEFRGL